MVRNPKVNPTLSMASPAGPMLKFDFNQRWDDSDSGIGIGIGFGIGIGTFSRWAESELNRLLNFQLESGSELESHLPGVGIGIDRFQVYR